VTELVTSNEHWTSFSMAGLKRQICTPAKYEWQLIRYTFSSYSRNTDEG